MRKGEASEALFLKALFTRGFSKKKLYFFCVR